MMQGSIVAGRNVRGRALSGQEEGKKKVQGREEPTKTFLHTSELKKEKKGTGEDLYQ